MVQGGIHRGVAVSEGFRVSLWPSPPQGLEFPPMHQPMPLRVFCTGASRVGGSSFWTWGLPKPPRCLVGPTGAGRRWSDRETAPGRRKGPTPAVTVLTAPG